MRDQVQTIFLCLMLDLLLNKRSRGIKVDISLTKTMINLLNKNQVLQEEVALSCPTLLQKTENMLPIKKIPRSLSNQSILTNPNKELSITSPFKRLIKVTNLDSIKKSNQESRTRLSFIREFIRRDKIKISSQKSHKCYIRNQKYPHEHMRATCQSQLSIITTQLL